MKIKITVSYEIDDYIDEETLKQCYHDSIQEAFDDINEVDHFHNLVNFDTENILKIEILKKQ